MGDQWQRTHGKAVGSYKRTASGHELYVRRVLHNPDIPEHLVPIEWAWYVDGRSDGSSPSETEEDARAFAEGFAVELVQFAKTPAGMAAAAKQARRSAAA